MKYCKAAIACHYLCGDTYSDIRENMNVKSNHTIDKAVSLVDTSTRVHERKEIKTSFGLKDRKDTEREIVSYINDGMSTYRIAEIVGIDHSTVSKIAKKNGVSYGKGHGPAADASRARRHDDAVERRGDKRKHGDARFRNWCRHTGADYEPGINVGTATKRFGMKCGICGIECSFDDKEYGHIGPTYPTIDHIVPLSKGGSHTWSNIQVACFHCNSAVKRDKLGAFYGAF